MTKTKKPALRTRVPYGAIDPFNVIDANPGPECIRCGRLIHARTYHNDGMGAMHEHCVTFRQDDLGFETELPF